MADDTTADETTAGETTEDDGGSVLRTLLLLVMLATAVSYALKRKREQELDEALWEEPRPI